MAENDLRRKLLLKIETRVQERKICKALNVSKHSYINFRPERRADNRESNVSSWNSERSRKRSYSADYGNRDDYSNSDAAANFNTRRSKRRKDDETPVKRDSGYRYLENLSVKEPHEMVIEIIKVDSQFDTYLKKEVLNTDWLILIVFIIRTVCSSHFKASLCGILEKLCNSRFLSMVSKQLGEIRLVQDEETIQKLPAFVSNLVEFYARLLDTLPSMAVEKDVKKIMLMTKNAIEDMKNFPNVLVNEELIKKLDILVARANDHMALIRERLPSEPVRTFLDRIADCAPPENFRELSLYPTYDDVTRKNLGFVRPNKIKGAYESVDHYLDVQFRLLREDFIDPLRTGLRKYLQTKSSLSKKITGFKCENVRFYPGIRFEKVTTSRKQKIGVLVNFDPQNSLKNLRWEHSKRFMFGSLLLFTKDDFVSFFCGTVLERRGNRILVALTDSEKIDQCLFDVTFLMAESEVFFEPYFLVMKLMKNLDDSTFPLTQYIVQGKSTAEYPSYLHKFDTWKICNDNRTIKPLDTESWPTAEELKLDSFQYRAFKAALTQDFCVIQGPPGTGKTFLGLKIVENILRNAKEEVGRLPSPKLKLPILVVCYTNHALDQFLEGVLEFTNNIIRIGGQSRSEAMAQYNLRGRHYKNYYCNFSGTFFETKSEINDNRREIETISRARETIEQAAGILNAKAFRHLRQSADSYYREILRNDETLLQWLLDGSMPSAVNKRWIRHHDNFSSCSSVFRNASNDDAMPDFDGVVDEWEIVDEDDMFTDDTEHKFHKFEPSRVRYSVTLDDLKDFSEKRKKEMKYDYCGSTLLRRTRLIDRQYEYLRELLSLKNQKRRKVEDLLRQNPINLSMGSRWAIYWSWVSVLQQQLGMQLAEVERKYRNSVNKYEELRQLEDLGIVKRADIVGMTTTGAARLNLMLKSLKPAVVIVEEAAEVLEAHIVASLTNECQQVILIGDHEQLKPSTAVYELSKNYNISVSLFERMLLNGMPCPVLNVQHRMRPEISCLISPLIYPDLENHPSVLEFEPIKGIKKNVFFVNHSLPEKIINDSGSKENRHEAEFLVMLAKYLVQQGYKSENITILTIYSGQMFLLRDLKRDHLIVRDIKCIVVDKYQGEENDIILLSLVRSNDEGKIGFLNCSNRVCVALSRAKKGFYMVGNMECLTKNSDLWRNIQHTLTGNSSIGENLELYCDKHDRVTLVSAANDFAPVREGGCDIFCRELMKCGHYCPSLCHSLNKDHTLIKCWESCKRSCYRNHSCKQLCFEECLKCSELVEQTLPCNHVKCLPCHVKPDEFLCDETVDEISPLCNHPVKRKCHESRFEVKCKHPCEDRLDCGHACTRSCHKNDDPDHTEFKCRKDCERLNKNCSNDHQCQKLCFEECGICYEDVLFVLPCNHEATLCCATDLSEHKCLWRCDKICSQCNQPCKKFCWEDCSPCENRVMKIIPECGHEVNVKCFEEPKRKLCRQMCEFLSPCGHKCQLLCKEPCSENKCMEMIRSEAIQSDCGHPFVIIYCYLQNDVLNLKLEDYLYFCDEPCSAVLECGDLCSGTCGKCWQGRLHVACQKPCGKILICGHSCKYPCRQLCPPCGEPCSFRCQHSTCNRKCGIPCVSCKESYEWQCEHFNYIVRCGDIFNFSPCNKPCKLKIPSCGHDCIGFCGEPCPPLCRICNPEITEILFGYEDEPDARFVLLKDCNHVIEAKSLDQHLAIAPEGGEIVMKVCPLCKTPITKTLRYANLVKQTFRDIINVKKEIFKNSPEEDAMRKNFLYEFSSMKHSYEHSFRVAPSWKQFLRNCYEKAKSYSPRRMHLISRSELSAMTYYLQIFNSVKSRKDDVKRRNGDTIRMFEFFNRLLARLLETGWFISHQQMVEFSLEWERYHMMVDFCKVTNDSLYIANKDDKKVSRIRSTIERELFSCEKFTDKFVMKLNDLFKEWKIAIKSPRPLTSEVKRMINEAMKKDFNYGTTGHWFKCSNGHYYCITECGGAMQLANCPECGEQIGGTNHRYVPTAVLASDMDGATLPAWSSSNDMRNYQL